MCMGAKREEVINTSAEYYLTLVYAVMQNWGLTGMITAGLIAVMAVSLIGYVIARLNKS
jgi:hypothetical protein